MSSGSPRGCWHCLRRGFYSTWPATCGYPLPSNLLAGRWADGSRGPLPLARSADSQPRPAPILRHAPQQSASVDVRPNFGRWREEAASSTGGSRSSDLRGRRTPGWWRRSSSCGTAWPGRGTAPAPARSPTWSPPRSRGYGRCRRGCPLPDREPPVVPPLPPARTRVDRRPTGAAGRPSRGDPSYWRCSPFPLRPRKRGAGTSQ